MKKYISMALAAMALVSCSNDEFLEINQEAISFGEAFVDNATRAYDPSYGANANALKKFNVWGAVEGTVNGTSQWSSIFAGEEVTGTVGSNVWTCTKTQYWIPEANYKFAAVVNGGKVEEMNDGVPTKVAFETNDGKKDLLYAFKEAQGQPSDNGPVKFIFNHMLAKVVLAVENTSNTNGVYYYKVSDVQLLNPMISGWCEFEKEVEGEDKGPYWSNRKQSGDVPSFSLENVTSKISETETEEIHDGATKDNTTSNACLIIPYRYDADKEALKGNNNIVGDFKVKYTYSLWMKVNGSPDVKITEVTPEPVKIETDILPGYSYRFVVKLGLGQPIQFSVEVDPTWVEDHENNDIEVK